ncbi:50S ribosomal protein L11 [Erysipelothrix larvae]|uniref:Large ribosomal subunit protein uL11 n=1 Tax=Erysipelothrix larvae TaxID=1514105 RepID=A0A0X8H1X5_9FIRM|nr:50S ribosomal protein L11 [Erysipelothrix larvae]AMC94444.1 50S ribosomal protein L11 [Erysipelothrix larvae]
MSKRIARIVKLQFPAGGARPGPALAGVGINMPQFCSAFNDASRERGNDIVPVEITVYDDKSFNFVLKTTPAAVMLKRVAGVPSGAATPSKQVVATITVDQLREVAEYKMPDLNAVDIEGAMAIIAGTAKNMGIKIEGYEGK